MPSPAFHNHTCDSSAETTISHQLPGTCHHAILFYQGCILGHCGAKKGGGATSCPQGENATNRTWPYQLPLPGAAASEPGCRRFEKATQANRDAQTADSGLGSESLQRRQRTKSTRADRTSRTFGYTAGTRLREAEPGTRLRAHSIDRGGRMAPACISAGMRCTCLKLRDLVSACESSSSSGSPSGPPASSSPAPEPRTADHVHLAHCTGDRICQGLNAMSAAAAPAVGERRPLPSKWRGLDRRRQRRRRPADVAQRAPSGRAQRFLPRPRSAARPRSSGPPRRSSPPRVPARPPASSPASPAPRRWALGSAPAWSSLGRRGAAPLEPPPRTELLARRAGAAAWKRAPPAALVAPGLGQGLLDRARPPRGIRACRAPRAAAVHFRACARRGAVPLPLLSVFPAART